LLFQVNFSPSSIPDGAKAWDMIYGDSTKDDVACDVVETDSGKYVICGYSNSTKNGDYDFYLLEISE